MTKRNFTVAELMARAAGNTSAEIVLELLLLPDYAEFVALINRAVDMSFQRMAENPELRKDRTEDQLTIELVTLLRQLGLDAAHEAKVGGHCDVTVRGPSGYMWLAEAKRHNQTMDWIYQGFQQLNTRYSTGLPTHDHGALILYLYRANALGQMSDWQAHLGGKQQGIVFANCPLNPLAFVSTHTHDRSGLPYHVRHIPLSLHFAPQDKPKKAKKKSS